MRKDERTGLFLPEHGLTRGQQQATVAKILASYAATAEDIARFDDLFPAMVGGGIGYVDTKITSQVDGGNLTASNTATSLLPGQAKYTIPANFFTNAGQVLKFTITGRLGNIVTTPGTLTIDVRMGPTANIIVWNGGAMQLSSTAHTTLPFYLEILLTVRAVGSGTAANLMGQGRMTAQALSLTAVADSTTTPATLLLPNTTPAVGTGFDSTVAMLLDLFGTFSLNNANAILVHQYVVESLNYA